MAEADQQWMQQLAEVGDAATEAAFQDGAQPTVQAQPRPVRVEDDVPTEPATSPRQVDPQAREWPVQLQPIQGRVLGAQEEPERYASPFILGPAFGRTDFSRIFIFEPPDFFADFLAGFFLLIFVRKSAQKNPPGKSPAKSSKIYTTKILRHISADCPGQS